jgi:ABC-type branched-subunit amino acid transport system substrate-binding protein
MQYTVRCHGGIQMRQCRRPERVAVVAVVCLLTATCAGNSSSTGGTSKTTGSATSETAGRPAGAGAFPEVNEPGVTSTEIRVSGVTATTNPLGGNYGSAYDGVQAYFDMINDQGGIYGRKLVLAQRHDDQLANNLREVQSIIDNDKPFAVLPVATALFTGAEPLAKAGIPTFGWNIQEDWVGPPNLFGHVGALCLGSGCTNAAFPWIAHRLGKTRIAAFGYSVTQSASCVDHIGASFAKYPTAKVVFADKSLSFGVTDVSADVKRMIDAKADLVTTCMDENGTLTLVREMHQQGIQAQLFLPNGYDAAFMARNASLFEGTIVGVQEAPFETTPRFPALRDFVHWMDARHAVKNENSLIGWINADELVAGLKGAGPNFTREKVIAALNQMTAYDAGGLTPPIDWTKRHTDKHSALLCAAYVRVHNGKFVPQFGEPGKPLTCLHEPVTDVAGVKIVSIQ